MTEAWTCNKAPNEKHGQIPDKNVFLMPCYNSRYSTYTLIPYNLNVNSSDSFVEST